MNNKICLPTTRSAVAALLLLLRLYWSGPLVLCAVALSSSSSSSFRPISAINTPQSHTHNPVIQNDDNNDYHSNYKYEPHLRAKIAHSVAKGERRAHERAANARSVCNQCHRPPSLCVCHVLATMNIPTLCNTQIVILQHPNERRKKNLSTVPLLRLALREAVQVHVGYKFDASEIPAVQKVLQQGRTPLLLFPSPNAISLDQPSGPTDDIISGFHAKDIVNNHDDHNPTTNNNNLLILIDGTWSEAKRMVRDSPSLREVCQAVQFTSDASSIYHRLRREPANHCVSTLEACARALSLLEPRAAAAATTTTQVKTASDCLYQILEAHVDAHLTNAGLIKAPRSVGATNRSLYEKNRRRREIEMTLFANNNHQHNHTKNQVAVTEHNATMLLEQPTIPQSSNKTTTTSMMMMLSNHNNDVTNKVYHKVLPDGAILRSLKIADAPLVNSWSSSSSMLSDHAPRSLLKVARRIARDDLNCCLGIQLPGNNSSGDDSSNLVACLVRYEQGALGMLHVQEAFRRRGYGLTLLQHATRQLQQAGQERIAFIVDGNHASEALFQKAGWERNDDHDDDDASSENNNSNYNNKSKKRQTGSRRAKRKWIHRDS